MPPQNRIGARIIELQQVNSTNNYATALAHVGMAQHGCVVLAHHQTAGKGQRHKVWETAAGANITASFIIEPSLPLAQAFSLSMAAALAAQRFFSHYAGDQTKVKWPNDLYWCDRKAGGILIENILSGAQWRYAVIGIGININQTAFDNGQAVSLRQITGKSYEIPVLINELCQQLQMALEELEANPADVRDAYHQVLYKRGERVRLRKESRVFEAQIKEVNASGQLIAHHITDEAFDVGEVEWVF